MVLYSLLTGRRPYRLTSASYRAIERTICEQDPRRPSTAAVAAEDADPAGTPQPMQSLQEVARARGTTPEKLRRQIRGDLDNIVMMALRKEPSRRYASAEQMAEDIERCLAGLPVLARKDTFWYRGSKFVRRNKIGVASAALLVLALAGGVLGTSRMAHLANQEAQHARIEALSGYEITNFLIEALMVAAPMRSQEQIGEVIALLDAHEQQIHRQYEHQPHLRANLHDAIGRVFLRLRRFERAEDVFTEAAEIRQTHFGDESLEMSLSLSNLGELAYMRGDFAAAESHLREALRLHRALPPGVHTDVAEAANNLAAALRSLGRLEEAEQLHREALTLRRQRLGPKDPLVAESLNNLAGVHLARGDYDLALDGLRESLRIREQILGRNHPLTAESLNNLAVTLHHLARLDEAAAAYRESIERMREVPAVDRTHLARSATNLADIERRNGNLAQARNLLDEALEIQQQQSGEEPHPSLATTLASLAQLEHELDNPAAAEDHWREALRIRRAAFPRPHATIATTLVGYGSFLVDRQRPAEALPLLRQGCDEYEAALPAEHWLRAYAQVALGVCLTQLRQFEAAERILLEALPLLEASRGTDSEEATRARAALRELYELWEKPRQAERFTSDGDYE